MLWLIPAVGVVATSVVLARSRAAIKNASGDVHDAPSTPSRPEPTTPAAVTRINVRDLALAAGAPSDWADFFALTAQGESGMNPNVGLGIRSAAPPWIKLHDSEAEASASCKVFRKNESWLGPCWPSATYCWGSGGLFALFPASALAAFRDDAGYRCAHPWSIIDPSAAMIYAAWYARRLQGWSNWKGTVISTRMGWANPSAMGKAIPSAKRTKWGRHCREIGLPESFLDRALPRWKPAAATDLWRELGVDDGWFPEKAEA